MTVRAAHVVLQVRGAAEVAVFLSILVAAKAPRANVLRRSVLEREDFRLVSTAVDVRLTRPVARLAPLPFRPPLGVQGGYEVWRTFVVFYEILRRHVCVARLARFRSHVQ